MGALLSDHLMKYPGHSWVAGGLIPQQRHILQIQPTGLLLYFDLRTRPKMPFQGDALEGSDEF